MAADLKLAALFTDHTVLQRDQSAAVWGSGDAGEEITVTFAGQKKSTQADPSGKWLIKLDPMPASAEGRDLIVKSSTGSRQSRITNILVGDVWLCSGQSNMHFQMKSTENAAAEIAAANNDAVRFFTVEHQFLQKPTDTASGAWKPISPTTAADCSAVAFYFAMALQPKIGVPIGLIISSVGGTRIDPADRRIGAPVDHVEFPVGAVAEHQDLLLPQIEACHRFAHAQRGDLGRHLGDDGGCRRLVGEALGLRLDDRIARGLEHHFVRRLVLAALAVGDAALVALQPVVEPFDGPVERGIGIGRLVVALQRHAATHVHGDVGAEQVALPFENDLALDRAAEIAVDGDAECVGDVASQRVAHVEALAAHGQLHDFDLRFG